MVEECVTCGKEYKNYEALKRSHYNKNSDHAPDNWDICDNCGKPCKRLQQHLSMSSCGDKTDRVSCHTCEKEYKDESILRQLHYSDYPSHAPDSWEICHQCNGAYKEIAKHWQKSTCNYKSFTEEQMSIITGILMGDGHLSRSEKNSRLVIQMSNKDYLKFVYEKMNHMCNLEPHLVKTASDVAKSNEKRDGWSSNPEDYQNIYKIQTINHPELNIFNDWYESGEKEFPEVNINPTILKHWYVCDGHLENNKNVSISSSNEFEKGEKIKRIFTSAGLPEPHLNKAVINESKKNMNIRFTVNESEEVIQYMGEPLPGFEHKWPSG